MAVLALLVGFVLTDPIVLDNGKIRIELEAELFAVQFVGIPGGKNFVEPLHVDQSGRKGIHWVNPGGAYVELVPPRGLDAAIMRGPAIVIEQRKDYVALLGPVSPTLGVRLRKEVRLEPDAPRAKFTVTVMGMSPNPCDAALRHVVRMPHNMRFMVEKSAGSFRVLSGASDKDSPVESAGEFWALPTPTGKREKSIVLGALADAAVHVNADGLRWHRRLPNKPEAPTDLPEGVSIWCKFGNGTSDYLAAMQGPQQMVTQAAPLVYVEMWSIEQE